MSFLTVFSERSHAGAKRNSKYFLGPILILDHVTVLACTFIDFIECFIIKKLSSKVTLSKGSSGMAMLVPNLFDKTKPNGRSGGRGPCPLNPHIGLSD